MPSLMMVKKKSMQTVCANNLRQINLAITMYTGDFSGWLNYRPNPITASQSYYWSWVMYKNEYVRKPDIYGCPAALLYEYNPATPVYYENSAAYNYSVYGINAYFVWDTVSIPVCRVTTTRQPSKTVMGADSRRDRVANPTSFIGSWFLTWWAANPIGLNGALDDRHNNSTNILYVDGHIGATVSAMQVLQVSNNGANFDPNKSF